MIITFIVLFIFTYFCIQLINLHAVYHLINDKKYYNHPSKKDIVIQIFIPFYTDLKKTFNNFKNLK